MDRYLLDKPLLLIGEDGANLVNRSTPTAFIAEGKYRVNNHAHVLDGLDRTRLDDLRAFIHSINLEPYLTGMAQPKMNQAQMNSIPVALPPLAEQRRIVAKVEELLALCDALEARQTTAREQRARLVHSALDHLTETAGPRPSPAAAASVRPMAPDYSNAHRPSPYASSRISPSPRKTSPPSAKPSSPSPSKAAFRAPTSEHH